jgi:hypothetical protein
VSDLDHFAAYAERFAKPRKPHAPKVVTSDADAPMKPTAMEQAQRDKGELLAGFKRAKKAEHQALLASEHGAAYGRMMAIVKRLPDSAVELVENLRKGWVLALSAQQKFVVLSMIDARIIRVREMDGRPPFDDPLPGQPDNLFIICRKIILGNLAEMPMSSGR